MLFISRNQWEAKPPPNGAFSPLSKWRVKGVVVHHSGVQNPPKGVNAVKAFERHHLSKGWDGVAYNWLVDESGTIFEGRGWGARGAAARGLNSRSVSVCYTGNGSQTVTENAKSGIRIVVAEAESYFKKPLWVSTHRRKAKTTCPGSSLAEWVERGMETPVNPSDMDWAAIVQYIKDLQAQISRKPLKRGARGLEVRVVQNHLNHRGFNAGIVDGIYGRRTKAAVKAFQKSQGFLKVNGVVDGNTFNALFLQ